ARAATGGTASTATRAGALARGGRTRCRDIRGMMWALNGCMAIGAAAAAVCRILRAGGMGGQVHEGGQAILSGPGRSERAGSVRGMGWGQGEAYEGLLRWVVIGVGVAARVVVVHAIAGIPHVADTALREGLGPAGRTGMRCRHNARAGVGGASVIWVEMGRSGAGARGTGEATRWVTAPIRGVGVHRERLTSLGLLGAGAGRQRSWLRGLGICGVLARGLGRG
ncbi:MAG: hypothetical protein FD142_3184, partial [bacterium]